MKPTAPRLFAIWIVGTLLGTAVIGITSPLLVRSYAPLHADTVRGVWTLPPGHTYRWRGEGYADTQIGPLGMPGKRSLGDRDDQVFAVALWGDSQAEGVCVSDDEKIFAQAQKLSAGRPSPNRRLSVYPLARSGEDAADWVTQMPVVERELSIDMHVLLIVDLPDLIAASEAPVPAPSDADVEQANAALAARLPAFVIQAARRLLTESDDVTRRRLRFSIGPVDTDSPTSANLTSANRTARPIDWSAATEALRRASKRPIVILYAPQLPRIIEGRVIVDDPADAQYAAMKLAAEASGLIVIDTREQLRRSARQGRWPHGFHNGYIGQGHLNAVGNSVVAAHLIRSISLREITDSR
jgi:hypothetical protein